MTITLAEAQARATRTADAAEKLRTRLADGDDVPAAKLVDAELAETHAARVLDAAEQRETDRAAADAQAQHERDVAAVKAERAAAVDVPPELAAALDAATAAVAEYVAMWRSHLDRLDDLTAREVALGVRQESHVPRSQRRSPFPALHNAIVTATREAGDWSWFGVVATPDEVWAL